MRLLFITQEDPFYIKIFFETFFKNYKDIGEVQGIVICRTMGRSKAKLIKQMYGFYGPADFLRVGYRYIKTKVLSSLLKNSYWGSFYDIEHLCRYYHVKVLHSDDINNENTVSLFREMKLDVITSVAAPTIFKTPILSIPKWGCINIHNAKLPKYRGMLPNFWNMYHGEKTSAITIHTMDSEIDRGKVLLQREFEIKPEESLDELIKRTKALGALYLIEVLDDIKRGTVKYENPKETESSYFSFPTSDDVKQFRCMGKRLL